MKEQTIQLKRHKSLEEFFDEIKTETRSLIRELLLFENEIRQFFMNAIKRYANGFESDKYTRDIIDFLLERRVKELEEKSRAVWIKLNVISITWGAENLSLTSKFDTIRQLLNDAKKDISNAKTTIEKRIILVETETDLLEELLVLVTTAYNVLLLDDTDEYHEALVIEKVFDYLAKILEERNGFPPNVFQLFDEEKLDNQTKKEVEGIIIEAMHIIREYLNKWEENHDITKEKPNPKAIAERIYKLVHTH